MGHAGDAIKAIREEQGLHVRELAHLAGVSDGYLYEVEAGIKVPALKWRRRVAVALARNIVAGWKS
jgi:transcriptional regulator with XRE-family HTH domain